MNDVIHNEWRMPNVFHSNCNTVHQLISVVLVIVHGVPTLNWVYRGKFVSECKRRYQKLGRRIRSRGCPQHHGGGDWKSNMLFDLWLNAHPFVEQSRIKEETAYCLIALQVIGEHREREREEKRKRENKHSQVHCT